MARHPKRKPKTNEPPDAVEEKMLSYTDPEAAALYDLAVRVKELSPWRWMEETDLIGVEDPETREMGFISVMGSVGEYEAVAVYLGAEGLYGFIDFVADDNATADRLLELSHLQAAFVEREYLEKWDRDLIKQQGVKLAGTGPWPTFRAYRPGYQPWLVTLTEARFLIHALSQTIEVATRVRDDVAAVNPRERIDDGGFPMRVSLKTESALTWEDQVWQIPRPKSEPIHALVDNVVLEQLKGITQSRLELEADLFLVPVRIGKPGQRPLAAYLLMVADRESGFLLGGDTMNARGSLAAMHASIPNSVAKMLLSNQVVPRWLIVRSESLLKLLKPLMQSLSVGMRLSNKLPSVDEAANSMREWMREGKL